MTTNPLQPIYNLPEIYYQLGCRHVILSPGSRSAPLALAFKRQGKFTLQVISDERSAAFVALGIALNTKNPVILVCTSGSALLNYYPAIAEAFYQHVPLIVLSADRPAEWIDQNDGQSIRQNQVLHAHVKKSYTFQTDYQHPTTAWDCYRKLNESFHIAVQVPYGPVHINIPFREPFYPTGPTSIEEPLPVIPVTPSIVHIKESEEFQKRIAGYSKILFVIGQQDDLELSKAFTHIHVPILCDSIGNLRHLPTSIYATDGIWNFITEEEKKELEPQLVLTIGNSILSKNIKQWLRHCTMEHWHIGVENCLTDIFQHLTHQIPGSAIDFISTLQIEQQDYTNQWLALQKKYDIKLKEYIASTTSWDDFSAIGYIVQHIPTNSIVHLANSMSVRYLNYFNTQPFLVQSNRGVSGIDGCLSTAVGYASTSSRLNTIIIGDQAFFYDRNAFWNQVSKNNLRIILLNNNGGVIFSMIDGPSQQSELEELFTAPHTLTAEHWCKEYGVEYYPCASVESLQQALATFYHPSNHAKVIEVQIKTQDAVLGFKAFKSYLKN